MLQPLHRYALLFFFFLLFSFPNYSESLTTDDERAILLGLKQHWGSPPSLHQWNSTSSPCDWPYISCIARSVTEIYLSGMNIQGPFPSTIICQLNNLASINLNMNNLSGSIPDGLSTCSKLETLDLSTNHLTGKIPGELFSMERLRTLNLHQNMFSGEIPTPMVAYNLEYIDLSSNHLNGSIPEDISNFYNLEYLDLSSSSFSAPIPARLSQLRQLYNLSLASNNLTGEIPRTLGLSSLTHTDLSHNQLSGDIRESVGHLRAMLTLRICLNHFSGRIPYELVKGKFIHNCFDEANLCSDEKDMGLPACSTELCSDYTIRGYINCSSKRHTNIIATCSKIAGILIVLVLLIVEFRNAWKRRKENEGEEWSMVSFQRLEFSKWEILGGLTDENLIGSGGSGKVYRVITGKGQRVAVKSIWHEQQQGQGLEKQFLAEVKILGGIRHRNIVKLLCCIRGESTKLIVYEYMDKQCLHKWLHGKKKGLTTLVLQWETRLKIGIGAAQGLCYMHHNCSRPIVHRDIKSSNILVDSEFNAKIADFGLAKMLASEEDPETASAIVGTFGYIAPEYGRTRKVNAKSDIYSFGVVLLELTTGREAVTANEYMNLAQWAHKHQREGNSAADAQDEEIKDPRYLEAASSNYRFQIRSCLYFDFTFKQAIHERCIADPSKMQ